jgi:hypothetical protein
MIFFQEEQTVSFDPIAVDWPVPWYETLYALYIFVVVVVLLARTVQIILELRRLRKLEKAGEGGARKWLQTLAVANLQARGLRRLAVLTFFLSCFEFTLHVNEASQELATMKASSPKWPLIYLGQKAEVVGFGILIGSFLYAVGFFFESRLERRMLSVNTAYVPLNTPTD